MESMQSFKSYWANTNFCAMFYKRPITPSKGIVTQIELDQCFDIIYKHTKFELNRCNLSKVIERTPTFVNKRTHGRTHAWTHARTGVTLNDPQPFFEWRGHKKLIVLECTVFSILDMFTLWHKTVTEYKIIILFSVVVWLFCFACIGGPVHMWKETGEIVLNWHLENI